MKSLLRLALIWLTMIQVAHASLRTAWQARMELRPDTWARVIRIENSNTGGEYPRTIFATVFEFAGILWFYAETNGTQSFSLHVGRLVEEKADFGPLLRAIDPGFGSFEVLPDIAPVFAGAFPVLPNGCFIESLAALETVLARGETVTKAALLSYYVNQGAKMSGHTVLAYKTPTGFYVIDTALSMEPIKLAGGAFDREPGKIASLLVPTKVMRARWLPVPRVFEVDSSMALMAVVPAPPAEGVTGALLRH